MMAMTKEKLFFTCMINVPKRRSKVASRTIQCEWADAKLDPEPGRELHLPTVARRALLLALPVRRIRHLCNSAASITPFACAHNLDLDLFQIENRSGILIYFVMPQNIWDTWWGRCPRSTRAREKNAMLVGFQVPNSVSGMAKSALPAWSWCFVENIEKCARPFTTMPTYSSVMVAR